MITGIYSVFHEEWLPLGLSFEARSLPAPPLDERPNANEEGCGRRTFVGFALCVEGKAQRGEGNESYRQGASSYRNSRVCPSI